MSLAKLNELFSNATKTNELLIKRNPLINSLFDVVGVAYQMNEGLITNLDTEVIREGVSFDTASGIVNTYNRGA